MRSRRFVPEEERTIDWYTQQLVVPLPEPFQVEAGQRVAVRFEYEAGAPLDALRESLVVDDARPSASEAHRRAERRSA